MLECVPAEAARQVTKQLKIPTIGIGAGPGVSGQVLVYHDMIGVNPGFKPKIVRTYANAFDMIQAALNEYDHGVKSGIFPLTARAILRFTSSIAEWHNRLVALDRLHIFIALASRYGQALVFHNSARNFFPLRRAQPTHNATENRTFTQESEKHR